MDIAPVTFSTMEIALGIAKQYGLRSLDSLHLATIVDLKQSSALAETSILAVSSDKDLVEASADQGIETINPEDERKALEKLQHIV